jgi:formylmethanofuran dehydrogenase subunit B
MGKVTCTLGEVRNRADFVLYWGCNPVETHPRHLTRYSYTPRGRLVPKGRKDRKLVVVDVRPTATSRVADRFLQIPPGRDFEVLTALRAFVRGRFVNENVLTFSGCESEPWRTLAHEMRSARWGVIFFGLGLTATRGKHMNVAALLALTRELNSFTKFAAMPMRDHGNEAGSDNVLSWTTSYPFALDFSRGYPRYNPGEYTGVDLLGRRDVDAALIVGSDPAATMPRDAIEHLARIPTAVLDPRVTATSRLARVHITTSAAGISAAGTAYRMDKVPLPVKAVLKSPYPDDETILRRLLDEVKGDGRPLATIDAGRTRQPRVGEPG